MPAYFQTRVAKSSILLVFLVGICITFTSNVVTAQQQQTAVSEDFLRFINAKLDTVYDEREEANKGAVAERKPAAAKKKQYGFSFLGQGFLGVYTLGKSFYLFFTA